MGLVNRCEIAAKRSSLAEGKLHVVAAAKFKIAIVGSGPAGLSAAGRAAALDREAGRDSPSYVLIEAFNHPSKTIFRYQKGKNVMAEPGYLELRSDLPFAVGSREVVLGGWDACIGEQALNIKTSREVKSISGSRGAFTLRLNSGDPVEAETVILAIGLEGNPRKLAVEGDTPENVQYQLDDPDEYAGETIIVVGAGDSAVENALALAHKNHVLILNRGAEFNKIKDGNQALLIKAATQPQPALECVYNAGIHQIERLDAGTLTVHLKTPEGIRPVKASRVIARLGGTPPRGFLESCGIRLPHAGATALPDLSEQYETNVPGLYVIGSLAGYPLIKQAMNQGYDVVEFIHGRNTKPVDYGLLDHQFAGLPYELETDRLMSLLMTRVPMFRQLNKLAFREVIIESRLYVSYPDEDTQKEALERVEQLKKRVEQLKSGVEAARGQRQAGGTGRKVPSPQTTNVIAPGHEFYRAGDYGVTFFTVVDGEVVLESPQLPGGRRILGRGDFFGEMSLLAGRPRIETAIAGPGCVVVATPRKTMLKLMSANEIVRKGIDWIFVVRELQRHFAPTATVEELRSIADEVAQRQFPAGQVLWRAGDDGRSIHVVRNGTVALYRERDKPTTILAEIRAGQLVGDLAVFNDGKRRDTAIAAVATETIEVQQAVFARMMSLDTEQREVVQRRASSRLVQNASWEARPESSHLLDFMLAEGLGEATNVLVIDEYLCVGCDNCEKACAETHGGVSRLDRKAGNTRAHLHIPVACRHCQQPHCMKDCPPNAIHRAENGEVIIDDSCIGCGHCETNCPYDVIRMEYAAPEPPSLFSWILFGRGSGPGEQPGFHPDPVAKERGKKAVKCDACVGQAGGPACVSACPTGAAIRIGAGEFTKVIDRTA